MFRTDKSVTVSLTEIEKSDRSSGLCMVGDSMQGEGLVWGCIEMLVMYLNKLSSR